MSGLEITRVGQRNMTRPDEEDNQRHQASLMEGPLEGIIMGKSVLSSAFFLLQFPHR